MTKRPCGHTVRLYDYVNLYFLMISEGVDQQIAQMEELTCNMSAGTLVLSKKIDSPFGNSTERKNQLQHVSGDKGGNGVQKINFRSNTSKCNGFTVFPNVHWFNALASMYINVHTNIHV